MALVLKDRVKETTTTTGTGTVTLAGAVTGFQSFSVVGNGNVTYYVIAGQNTSEWEVGIGTYTSSGTTLSRTTVLESSNGGSLVNFSAGVKDVFVTYPAEKAIYEEPNGETLIDGGPITVLGTGVTSVPTLEAELGKFVGNVNSFGQIYNLNQNDGSNASADFVAYNDLATDGYTNFVDMGINSSTYTSVDYPIFTPGSAYLFHDGDNLFIGTATTNKDVVIFTGGVDTANEAMRIVGSDQSVVLASSLEVGGALDVAGAATFGSTVLLNADPTLALQAATKQYVDNAVSTGLHIHEPVRVERGSNLNATYDNGTDGVGATLTNAGTQEALVIDGISVNVADRVLVYGQTAQAQNGVYVVTTAGDGSTNWVLTRASDADTYDPQSTTALGGGDYFFVQEGLTGAGESYVCTNEGTIIFGTTAITFTQFSASPAYTGTAPINVTGQVISLTGTVAATNGGTGTNTVTTGDLLYGSATNTWSKLPAGGAYKSLTMNAGGTQVEWNAVALDQSGAISGSLGPTNGGTGLNSYATGDIIYSSATNTLAKLSGNTDTTAKYLRQAGTGSASQAPTWSTLAAGDITSGTLGITYGGTGASTESGARTNLGATTLGSNLFTITNPSALAYPQFNADNTVSALDAATFRAAIGAGTGSGTVTSVAIAGSTGINVSGSPITSSGTITLSLDSNIGGVTYTVKTANYTAVAKDAIIADTTAGSFTITLPATPTTGSQVIIADGGNWAVNNLTIARNASTIEGIAEDLICDVQGASLQLVYNGSTWEVYAIAASTNNNIGYKNVPPVGTQTGSYTLVTADVGKYVQVGSGGSITIPNSVFSEGDIVSIFNNTTGNITINCSIGTAYIAGTDTDKATMTLATRGVATVLFISGTVCVVSGNVS